MGPHFLTILGLSLGAAPPLGASKAPVKDVFDTEMSVSSAPGFAYAVVDGDRTITARQLLSHPSGFFTFRGDWSPDVSGGADELERGVDRAAEARTALFIGLAVLPIVFVSSMLWAWPRRAKIRVKARSGADGASSHWFPLLTTLAAAGATFVLVPRVGGGLIATLRVFTPDFGLAPVATAVTGRLWAIFRLAGGYTGRSHVGGRGCDGPDVPWPPGGPRHGVRFLASWPRLDRP